MSSGKISVSTVSAVIVDERMQLSMDDICKACQSDQITIIKLVEEGVLQVQGRSSQNWQFSGNMLPRALRAVRLKRDLELNTAGVAFALDLLAEIESLRKRLQRYDREEVFEDE